MPRTAFMRALWLVTRFEAGLDALDLRWFPPKQLGSGWQRDVQTLSDRYGGVEGAHLPWQAEVPLPPVSAAKDEETQGRQDSRLTGTLLIMAWHQRQSLDTALRQFRQTVQACIALTGRLPSRGWFGRSPCNCAEDTLLDSGAAFAARSGSSLPFHRLLEDLVHVGV